jgi:hypothetical protein
LWNIVTFEDCCYVWRIWTCCYCHRILWFRLGINRRRQLLDKYESALKVYGIVEVIAIQIFVKRLRRRNVLEGRDRSGHLVHLLCTGLFSQFFCTEISYRFDLGCYKDFISGPDQIAWLHSMDYPDINIFMMTVIRLKMLGYVLWW